MSIRIDKPSSSTRCRSTSVAIEPRPPTPPREFLFTDYPSSLALPRSTTALSSVTASSTVPSSSADSSSERSKTVKWTTELATVAIHDPDSGVPITPSRKPQTSATSTPRSLKSILKPPQPILGSPGDVPFSPMLQSFMEALSGADRGSKLDQYIMFCNTLKSYGEIPEIGLLVAEMPIIIGFLKRDMEARVDDSERQDSQIIQQAIKLFSIIVWTPRLVEAVDERSLVWFLQRVIQNLEDPASTKAAIGIDIHILASSRLPGKVMTAERVNRILTVLEALDSRAQGKTIAKDRLNIYIRLLSIAKSVMQARTLDWMHIMFRGLLSKERDLRFKALGLLNLVTSSMNGDKGISRAITSTFNRAFSGHKFFGEIQRRLEHLVNEDHEGVFVAQVWSAVVILQRGRSQWEYFNPWLRIIQTCFNSSDRPAKLEAQAAWSKFIYAAIGSGPQRKMLDLLRRPLESYSDPKCPLQVRKAVLANIMLLLYYGLRPNATNQQLSDVWDIVVVGLVEKLIRIRPEGAVILAALLNNEARIWTEKRAFVGPTLNSEEIPRIDPRWVRSHCSMVLRTIETSIWHVGWSNGSVTSSRTIWAAFMKSLADAGAKEVKISSELTGAVGEVTNFFERLWDTGTAVSNQFSHPDVDFVEVFCFLVRTAWESLGTLSFVERPSQEDRSRVSPASTPPRKSSASTAHMTSSPPAIRVFKLLLCPARGTIANDEYFEHVKNLVSMLVNSLDSRRKKLSLLASLIGLLSEEGETTVELRIWDILASLVVTALPSRPSRDATHLNPISPESELVNSFAVLRWGFLRAVSTWELHWGRLADIVQEECGDAVLNAMFVEPLAESLQGYVLDGDLPMSLHRASWLFRKATFPNAPGHSELTAAAVDGRSLSSDFLISQLGNLGNMMLKLDCPSVERSLTFLNAVTDYLERASRGAVGLLQIFQEGLGSLVCKVHWKALPQSDAANATASIIAAEWSKCLQLLNYIPCHDDATLGRFSILVSCGFESPLDGVVSNTITAWNHTFGQQNSLHYPDCVRISIARLKNIADLMLPTFPGVETETAIKDGNTSPSSTNGDRLPESPISTKRVCMPSPIVYETPYSTRTAICSTRKRAPSEPEDLNSQVEFVFIAPDDENITNPQMFTQFQKEMRVRQSREARLSPEFGSSPIVAEEHQSRIPDTRYTQCANDNLLTTTSTPWSPKLSQRPRDDTDLCRDNSYSPVLGHGQSAATIMPPNAVSEDQAAEEMFVDAPDHIGLEEAPLVDNPRDVSPCIDGEVSPLKDVAEIAVEIPQTSLGARGHYPLPKPQRATNQCSSSPRGQVTADDGSASSTPARKQTMGRDGKKRKRPVLENSEEILDTIIVSAQPVAQSERFSPNPHLSSSHGSSKLPPENSRPGKRAKFADVLCSNAVQHQSTPIKRQRRSGKKLRTSGKSPATPKLDEASFVEETQISLFSSVKERKSASGAANEHGYSTPSRPSRYPTSTMTMMSPVTHPSHEFVADCQQSRHVFDPQEQHQESCPLADNISPFHECDDRIDTKSRQSSSPMPAICPSALSLHVGPGQMVTSDAEQSKSATGALTNTPSAVMAMESIKQAMQLVEVADMTVGDLESIEDEMFMAFAQLRTRRKLMG